MSRFLRTLSKIGLVELDPEEQARVNASEAPKAAESRGGTSDVDKMLQETEALLRGMESPAPKAPAAKTAPAKAPAGPAKAPAAAAPPPPRPKSAPPSSKIEEGKPFADIYAEAQIPAVPFPAEKLNRLLEGLRAMDPAVRKAAVMAMDEADDTWSITDPLQDAQRKVVALQQARNRLRDVVGVAEAEVAAELEEAEAYQRAASEKIRAEIAELEALLQQEMTGVAERKAGAHAKLHATREAAAREAERLEQEVSALNGMLATFAPPI